MIYYLKYFCMMIFIRKKRQWNDICDFPSIWKYYFIQWHTVKLFQGKQIYMEVQYMYIDIECYIVFTKKCIHMHLWKKKISEFLFFYRNQVKRQFIGSEYGSLMEKVTSCYILQCRFFYTYVRLAFGTCFNFLAS